MRNPIFVVLIALVAFAQTTSRNQNISDHPKSGVTAAIERVRPSVVQIQVRVEFRFVNRPAFPVRKVGPAGSGFLADKLGHVITAGHVIEEIQDIPRKLMSAPPGPEGPVDAQSIKTELFVGFPNEQLVDMKHRNYILGNFSTVPAKVLTKSTTADVAVLEVETNPFATWKKNKPMEVNGVLLGQIRPETPQFSVNLAIEGEQIAIAGFPLTVPSLVTNVGWIASRYGFDDHERLVQIGSVQINHGNSGGPVFRISDGAVIGIAQAYLNAPVPLRIQVTQNQTAEMQLEGDSGLCTIIPIQQAVELLPH